MAVATSTDVNPNDVAGRVQRRLAPNQKLNGASSSLSSPEDSPSTSIKSASDSESQTVFYLAYGSNMCAETFRRKRGIKPLSEVNVYVPQLEFNLKLRGMPYLEPCFANVNFREPQSSLSDELESESVNPSRYSDDGWDGGLMGVVYEVTHEDYRQIIRTEGGGSGYKEIQVPCVPLRSGSSTAHTQPDTALPPIIFAKTLYAALDPPPDSSNATGQSEPWWKRIFSIRGQFQSSNPAGAQATARYLKLITDGAREHELPAVYQQYLKSLQPYIVTTLRQQVGKALVAVVAGPALLGMVEIAKRLADKDGKYPAPIAAVIHAIFNSVWITYNHVLKPLFGDGERTESGKGRLQPVHGSSLMARSEIIAEEKLELLGE